MKRHKVLSEHIFEDIYKDIDVDSTTKTIILKSVQKTAVSVGLRQIRRSDLPGRFSFVNRLHTQVHMCVCDLPF